MALRVRITTATGPQLAACRRARSRWRSQGRTTMEKEGKRHNLLGLRRRAHQAKVVKINRDKTNRRETARRQKGDAHNVRLTLRLPSGTWDQDVEEEHLTLLDGRRFETKNYACDALPARRRKATKRLLKEEGWQDGADSGLARGGKKKRPFERERLTPEAIEDLILYSCKESKSWWVACDKDPETGISRLAGQDRDDYFYRSFGTGELEDLKWGQGKRVKKGIRIVRRSGHAVTLEGQEKPLVFRLSGEMHDGEPVYRFLAGARSGRAAQSGASSPAPVQPAAPPARAVLAAPAAATGRRRRTRMTTRAPRGAAAGRRLSPPPLRRRKSSDP